MVRVNMKGIHWTEKRLKDGRTVRYWYAWRGGPRLAGEPGTPDFMASYAEASKAARKPRSDTLSGLLDRYADSALPSSDRTRKTYLNHIATICAEFGTMTIAELERQGSRSLFLEWRDEIARTRGARTADYVFAVFAAGLAWAKDREIITRNPCERAGRLHSQTRKDSVWTLDEEAALMAHASPQVRLAVTLAAWTGQRQGDILRLTWKAYDGASLVVRQSKTGVMVRVPVAAPLRAVLDATPRQAVQIVANRSGVPYTESGFRASFGKALDRSGVIGRTFHDWRGTFSTRAGEAGATDHEIAAVTGHANVFGGKRSALHTNYLSLTYQMAEACIQKLERWHDARTNLQTGSQTGLSV